MRVPIHKNEHAYKTICKLGSAIYINLAIMKAMQLAMFTVLIISVLVFSGPNLVILRVLFLLLSRGWRLP